MKIFLLFIISVLMLTACAEQATPTPSPIITPQPSPSLEPVSFNLYGQTLRDIPYCSTSAPLQSMDIYFPASGGPWPVLVYVHGGSWMHGDKFEGSLFGLRMPSQGYSVASINYRLYPQAIFPAMVEDVKCAIRSLRAHASEFNLDPDHIAVMGTSAGGHLSALVGTSDESAGWDVGEYLDQSSRVQAVIPIAAVTDLTQQFPNADIETIRLAGFDEGNISIASPINHVSTDDPPFLLIHGEDDTLVPMEQSALMYDRLTKAGVSAQFIPVENTAHAFSITDEASRKTFEEINQIILDFLNKYLK